MISPINNVNFKGVYTLKKAHVTKAQESVIEDIKLELNKAKEYSNFLASPIDDDKVALSRIYDFKKENNGFDTKYSYSSEEYIGTYNKTNPFNIKDYEDFQKQEIKEGLNTICTTLFGIMIFLASVFISTKLNVNKIPQNNGKATIIKDNIQTITKDSLMLLKK